MKDDECVGCNLCVSVCPVPECITMRTLEPGEIDPRTGLARHRRGGRLDDAPEQSRCAGRRFRLDARRARCTLLFAPASSLPENPMTQLLIRGGTVVNADREFRADVLCVDGKIVAVGAEPATRRPAREMLDAGGQLRDARRHRPAHAHAAAVHGHGRGRRLLHRHRGRPRPAAPPASSTSSSPIRSSR